MLEKDLVLEDGAAGDEGGLEDYGAAGGFVLDHIVEDVHGVLAEFLLGLEDMGHGSGEQPVYLAFVKSYHGKVLGHLQALFLDEHKGCGGKGICWEEYCLYAPGEHILDYDFYVVVNGLIGGVVYFAEGGKSVRFHCLGVTHLPFFQRRDGQGIRDHLYLLEKI